MFDLRRTSDACQISKKNIETEQYVERNGLYYFYARRAMK